MTQNTLSPQSPLGRLLSAPMRPGRVVWLGIRPGRRTPIEVVKEAALDPLDGLRGDHYGNRTTRTRQLTLIALESLAAIASFLGRDSLDPTMLRRNIVMAGINPHALKAQTLLIGSAMISITGECHPCSRMEEILGPGGYNAIRGHGGVTARVIAGGTIQIGDSISRLPP
jgi:MOSC domain-containing protein YiiM